VVTAFHFFYFFLVRMKDIDKFNIGQLIDIKYVNIFLDNIFQIKMINLGIRHLGSPYSFHDPVDSRWTVKTNQNASMVYILLCFIDMTTIEVEKITDFN